MKTRTKLQLLLIVLFITSLVLTLYWYDWKLFVILSVYTWGNNLQKTLQK